MSLALLLTEQQQRFETLMSLLSSEQKLLTQGEVDGEALAQVAVDKRKLLEDIERVEAARRRVQKRLGYPDGANGAREAAFKAGCQADWESLLEKSERVARMNELTGQMLTVRMTHNQAMLDYIRQIAEKTLYKPDGRNSAQSGKINASA